MSAPSPVPKTELERIVQQACEDVLSSTTSYVHSETEQQNSQIINSILSSLVSAASASSESHSAHQQYKYAVNSTIIQHLVDLSPSHSSTTASTSTTTESDEPAPEPSLATKVMNSVSNAFSPDATNETSSTETSNTGSASTSSATQPSKGRRGMHSATGAYWNNETDGMWSYKYEGTATRPMDVVICVFWVAV